MIRLTNRRVLIYVSLLALIVWGGLLLFTRFVPPDTILSFVTFFILLGVALTCTFTPLAYALDLRFLSTRLHKAPVRYALRQAALLSLWIVLNLILRALHSWNIAVAIIIFIAVILIEVLFLAKK